MKIPDTEDVICKTDLPHPRASKDNLSGLCEIKDSKKWFWLYVVFARGIFKQLLKELRFVKRSQRGFSCALNHVDQLHYYQIRPRASSLNVDRMLWGRPCLGFSSNTPDGISI